MKVRQQSSKSTWNESFDQAIKQEAFNTSPAEALVRTTSYWLRENYDSSNFKNLEFLELGCGAGPNLRWILNKGLKGSGLDISESALKLCSDSLDGHPNLVDLIEGNVCDTPFESNRFHGIMESNVFQHLDKSERVKAFKEVYRLLKPGGMFCGYLMNQNSSAYKENLALETSEKGTINFNENGIQFNVDSSGLTHFFSAQELEELLTSFSSIDLCLVEYDLPEFEAIKRGYKEFRHSFYNVLAIK